MVLDGEKRPTDNLYKHRLGGRCGWRRKSHVSQRIQLERGKSKRWSVQAGGVYHANGWQMKIKDSDYCWRQKLWKGKAKTQNFHSKQLVIGITLLEGRRRGLTTLWSTSCQCSPRSTEGFHLCQHMGDPLGGCLWSAGRETASGPSDRGDEALWCSAGEGKMHFESHVKSYWNVLLIIHPAFIC